MVRTSFPPVESLSETTVQEAIPLVEIEGYVAQAYELNRYWVNDDNPVYSATLNMTVDGNQIILFRENISGVDLIRDCEEVLATGTVRVHGTQGSLDDLDGKTRQYINTTEWAPACPG